MGKNSKRNNKVRQQQQQQQQAGSGSGEAAASSVPQKTNNKKELNALKRRLPSLEVKQRQELNQLILQLLDLVQAQPPSPKDEWAQFVQLQKLLERIALLEEPLRKAVCQDINSDVDDQQRLAKVAEFIEWAKAAGVRSDGVEIAIFPGYELGLRATRDLAADEKVISVPRKLIFSEENLPDSDRRLFCNYPLLTNFNLAYALVIEKVRGADSEWKPYIDLLPAKYNTVLYFSVAQMQRLRGTAVGTVALRQCRVIARQYANMYKSAHIRPETRNANAPSMGVLYTQHGLCYELYRWAVSTVMTRQNMVPREMRAIDEAELNQLPISALIPYWDMANHRPGKITSFYDSGSRQMDCTAQEAYKAGEQFFIYYGDRSNADLLVHNGFVDLNNRKDYVKIRLGLNPTDPLVEKRARILATLKIDRKAELRVLPAPDFISGELLAFVRVFNMSPEQLTHWHNDLGRSADLLHIDCALETDHETRTWQYLYQRLKLLLAALDAAMRADDEVLKLSQLEIKENEATAGPAAGNEIDLMIVQYHRLERGILAGALQYAQEHWSKGG